jgi:hypothetical protein
MGTFHISMGNSTAMAADIVPIVFGGTDYSPYAPPSSYIGAGDFKSPKACNTAAGRERRPLFQIFLLEKKKKKNFKVVNRLVV